MLVNLNNSLLNLEKYDNKIILYKNDKYKNILSSIESNRNVKI
jgi:hypothetical protein